MLSSSAATDGETDTLPGLAIPALLTDIKAHWRLQLESRAKRAGRDWVQECAIFVCNAHGVVVPIHEFLLDNIKGFAEMLSAQEIRSREAIYRGFERYMKDAHAVVNSASEFPFSFTAFSTAAMLVGNHRDVMLAILTAALEDDCDIDTIAINKHTLGISKPRDMSMNRATGAAAGKNGLGLKGSETLDDFYTMSAGDDEESGFKLGNDHGEVAPRTFWGIQNALNCQFPDCKATEARDKLQGWLRTLQVHFQNQLSAACITEAEFRAYKQGWDS